MFNVRAVPLMATRWRLQYFLPSLWINFSDKNQRARSLMPSGHHGGVKLSFCGKISPGIGMYVQGKNFLITAASQMLR